MQFGSSGPYVPRNTQDFSVAVPSQFPPVNSSAANRPRQATRTPNRFHLPSGIFWWMFMIGLTLWVVLLFVIHLKVRSSNCAAALPNASTSLLMPLHCSASDV